MAYSIMFGVFFNLVKPVIPKLPDFFNPHKGSLPGRLYTLAQSILCRIFNAQYRSIAMMVVRENPFRKILS